MGNNSIDINLHGDETGFLMIEHPIDLFFQEVELAVKIIEREIWNIPEGLDIEKYVFNKYVSFNQIETEVKNFIEEYCEHASEYIWDCKVSIMNNEYLIINFTIKDEHGDELTNNFLIKN